ncbi:MAG: Zinc import ATP-binding protein ZnuC [Alphaproteobacteria bacterium MarineAlpha2_Bin1]|nr:MAG: Zinc import ATP-binding protein ZnuC [Alphaproteobacteria bacterium MarineAlpha2_Bin1]|tara:strand:+ start:549 stop:1301 length:753 start_codon:yes stop_codon:yes gene_type:complete
MEKNKESLVELNNVSVIKQNKWLIKNVSLEVKRGEIITIIGPNGSGKTTTAKIALGILKPDQGSIKKSDNLTISYVPQKITIDWTLPLKVKHFMGLTNKIDKNKIKNALKLTEIEKLYDNEINTLSGGEFQRVMIARAIARKPDLLILDEPLEGIDFNGETLLYNLIKRIRDQLNCGIILISHNLHMVMAATDFVICLNSHVCCSGTPNTVKQNKEYISLFGPRALEGKAFYTHEHSHIHEADGTLREII